jgi:hypothetical protein
MKIIFYPKPTFLLRAFYLIFFFCVPALSTLAGGDPVPAGGRSWGIANTTLTFRDGFAVYNNPAGLAGISYIYGFAGFDYRYGHAGLNTFLAGGTLPCSFGTFGIGMHHFGGELYSEQQIGLAFGKSTGLVSLGGKVNYFQVSMGEFGVKKTLTFEFGAIAEVIPEKLFLGASIYNFTQSKLADYQDERIPTVMKAGLSYHPSEKLIINVETEKDIDFPAIIKAGIEYEIVKYLKLRTGISSKPYVNYFGVGFNPGKLQFDYAFRTHSQLGASHNLSVMYNFGKIQKKKTTPTTE